MIIIKLTYISRTLLYIDLRMNQIYFFISIWFLTCINPSAMKQGLVWAVAKRLLGWGKVVAERG
jgi:hypothetical protein